MDWCLLIWEPVLRFPGYRSTPIRADIPHIGGGGLTEGGRDSVGAQ